MYYRRLVFLFFTFILFIVFLVVLLGHGHKTAVNPVHVKTLPEYANTTAAVIMTTDGLINGDDLHRQIRITISQDQRSLEVIQGYSGHVIDSHTFYNTNAAYNVFLRAINYSGFLSKAKNSKAPTDERGQCPVGFRYIFELNNQGNDVSRLWTSSCAVGTWGGNLETVQGLFNAQIPNYPTLTDKVNLQQSTL
jgi:hypothetical protein